PAILWAAYTLINNWLAHKRPPHAPATPTMGGFEAWREVLGGILGAAGIGGFLTNLDEQLDEGGEEEDAWALFVQQWWGAYQAHPVTASALVDLATACGLYLRGPHDRAASLGRLLRAVRDRWFGGIQVRKAGKGHGEWRLHQRGHSDVAGLDPDAG